MTRRAHTVKRLKNKKAKKASTPGKSKTRPTSRKRRATATAAPRKQVVARKAVAKKTITGKARKSATATLGKPEKRLQAPATVTVDVAEQQAMRAKFELGPGEWTKVLDAREKTQTVPWGYGHDKIAAMAIDPERLFIYWEVTDEAIARARAGLGGAGDDAGLDLRVHDVTGILFDGSNSHHSFDLGVARADRQWFVQVGRPTSTVVVELGLLARSGAFAKIARSHRVDFPRRDPAPGGPAEKAEWLTVRALPADHGRPELAIEPGAPPGSGRGARGPDQRGDAPEWHAARSELWLAGAPWFAGAPPELHETRFASHDARSFLEWFGADSWQDQWEFQGSAWQWNGPTLQEHWESGPQAIETDGSAAPLQVVTQDGGVTVQTWRGFTRVKHGPWRVEIKGIDQHGGRRVLARWELRRSWVSASGRERVDVHRWFGRTLARGARAVGASEQLTFGASEWSYLGASERRWLAGSELRLGGASEQRWLGASERRLGGEKESGFGGASERRLRGGSERRLGGASERRPSGGSDKRLLGSSENSRLPRG